MNSSESQLAAMDQAYKELCGQLHQQNNVITVFGCVLTMVLIGSPTALFLASAPVKAAREINASAEGGALTEKQEHVSFRGLYPIAPYVSGFFAVISLVLAFCSRMWFPIKYNQLFGYFVIGAWVILPPLWFWVEWSYLSSGLLPCRLEDVKHGHEVGRNVWLALVALLIAIFGVKWPVAE